MNSVIEFKPTYTPPKNVPRSEYRAPKPTYIRPATAPNGQYWPKKAAYLEYPKSKLDGLSSVTVDNTRNDSDVFVKLVYLSELSFTPVRVLFIPAYSKFKIENVEQGIYDVPYQDLNTGMIQKTDPFNFTESKTHEGVEFVDMSITIYKVRNGNMNTYQIPEDQF